MLIEKIAIVMPCLNEGRNVIATAQSLGFGLGSSQSPRDVTLILVDNASTDDTHAALERIQRASRPSSVLIAVEAERGYVPPRHHGVGVARNLADRMRVPHDAFLILQADADTIYETGYISGMRNTASKSDPNVLLEGLVLPPRDFVEAHPGFQSLSDLVDMGVERLFAPDSFDVVVDDKVAGFTLDTYARWGGHRREYYSYGEEVHSETMRFFMRGRIKQGSKIQALGAVARPSRRKIIENPIRHFTTAGFPREESWWSNWLGEYKGPTDLAAFEMSDAPITLRAAVATRRAHLVALFAVIPLVVARAISAPGAGTSAHPAIEALIEELPPLDTHVCSGELGPVFEAVFAMMGRWSRPISDTLDNTKG